MARLNQLADASLQACIGDRVVSAPVLAINAGGAATVRTTNAIAFATGGVFKSKAALAAQSIAITHRHDGAPVSVLDPAYVQPTGTTAFYVLAVNAATPSGAIAVVQGSYAGQSISYGSDLSKVLTGDGDIPEVPAGFVPFGVMKVVTAGGATFTPGTTLLDAANVTVTYYDVSVLPVSL
jgi:hypothetical protein